jgi:two-component system response regulator YesN
MKKILIVDDEYIVRLGLKTIVDWGKFGYAVDGEAANGKEAFDFFEKKPVDVILTDIKMPVMDGLELTRKVKAVNKNVQIIILSHYDEFSYAQEAIKLGAFRYILKSELTKTNLENVLKSLHLDTDVFSAPKQMTGRKEELEKFVEEYMLPALLRQPKGKKEGAVREQGSLLPIPMTPLSEAGEYVVLGVSCRITSLVSEAREKFPKTIKILFCEAFEDLTGTGRYYYDDFHFAAIVPVEKPQNADTERFLNEKIGGPSLQIVKNVRQYYNVNIFIGISSLGKIEDCGRLLQESNKARFDCFFSKKVFVGIFSKKNNSDDNKEFKNDVPVNYIKLLDLIDTNQKDRMLEYIQNIFAELRRGRNYSAVYGTFIDFLAVGKLIHEKYRLEEKVSLSENKFKHNAFFDLPFIDDVEMYIYELYLSILSAKQNGKAGYSHIVKKCIDFIQSDYEHNIGLSEAARYTGVSHSYLSFIFKQETGINFNTALSQYRIEKAKKILSTTSLKIYQVAEKVGFSNPYYFSKVFKEISGYTCKEYRDKGTD